MPTKINLIKQANAGLCQSDQYFLNAAPAAICVKLSASDVDIQGNKESH